MIKHTNNSNQIQLTGFGCIYCGKNYKTKINLQKHQVLCETLVRAKKEKNSNNEEEFATPTTKQMYKIILDLSIKCNHLEEKVEQMQKWVIQKRKKINILDWLNENQIPSQTLESWIQSIQIQEKEIEMILHRSFIEVLGEIGDRIFQMELKEQTDVFPVFAFTQKQNTLYVFHEKEWKEWTKPEIIHTFNQLHFQYVKTFIEWKRKNEDKINASDSLCELINKANIKLMGIHFKEDSMYHKGKALFYNKLKKELTYIVEYEYQF
jgi:hypothetical protein